MGLTLHRKKDESVVIKTLDGFITIQVVESNNTKLDITAPKSVEIWRKELLDENNQLLPRNRGTKSIESDEQNLHISGCESIHIPADSK